MALRVICSLVKFFYLSVALRVICSLMEGISVQKNVGRTNYENFTSFIIRYR
jgi:hypothetical protein